MFERYNEVTRRVVHWSVFMAHRLGSTTIETEHLLLGLLRQDQALAQRFLGSPWAAEAVLRRVEKIKPAREKIPGSFEVPLSSESKKVISFVTEEADQLSSKSIGTEHVLLGLLREDRSMAAKILSEFGVHLATTREALRRTPHESSTKEEFVREQAPLPQDIVDVKARIKFIKEHMEAAIAKHEFEKAQVYSNEEGKERDKLYLLCRKYGLTDWIFD